MDENKNEILDEVTENPTEEVEEVTEAVEEAAQEPVASEEEVEELQDEEIAEEAEEEFDDSFEAERHVQIEMLIREVKSLKRKNRILSAIVAVICVVAIAFGGVKLFDELYNPYNHMGYYNISEMTLADVAEMNDMTVEEVIDQLGLPEDIKANTYYDVVEFLVPVSTMAQMYGVDFETMKEAFQFGEGVTADSTWGEALDSMTLLTYLGSEETVEEFIAEYNLGEEVTSETLWGEIRAKVNKIDYERHLAEKATAVDDVTEVE